MLEIMIIPFSGPRVLMEQFVYESLLSLPELSRRVSGFKRWWAKRYYIDRPARGFGCDFTGTSAMWRYLRYLPIFRCSIQLLYLRAVRKCGDV